MNFLNPIVLFGLGAVLLPLLIHLLSKRRAKEVAFPSIKLLALMQTDRIRMLKIKQLLILILRTLVILLLILAFARPAIRSVFKADARISSVIIIDGSASMVYVDNGELLFNLALRKAEDIITLLKKDDTAAVIISGEIPTVLEPGLTPDKQKLLNSLEKSKNSWSAGSPARSLDMAFDLLKSSGALNREIYFLTDGAVNTLPDTLYNPDKNIRLYTVLLGPEIRRGSVIVDVDLVEKILVPGRKLTFRVKGLVGDDKNETDIEFFINGERKGKSRLMKRSGNIVETDFTYTPETQGWYSVYAAVNDGYFEPGERWRITVNITQKVNVLLAGGASRDMYFLEKALNPDPDNPMFSVRKVLETDIAQSDIITADVIVLSGVSDIPGHIYQLLLTGVVEHGKGLIVFPAKDTGSALYTDGIFRDIFPVTVGHRMVFKEPKDGNYAVINRFAFGHPILQGISRKGNFHRPEVKSFLKMIPSANVNVLARFSDNSMAVGEIACGKGRAVVFAVDAFSQDSELPLTGIFVPFFIRSVQYLSGTIINSGLYETEDIIKENIGQVLQHTQVTLKPFDSPAILVDINRSDTGSTIIGETAGHPGFYSVYVGNEERRRFGVNAPVSEIVFKRADTVKSAEAYKDVIWKEVDGSENIYEFIDKDRYGKELYGFFMVLAMVLLGVEMVIARKV